MTAKTVSVIVVSRERPDALRLCLTGLEQLIYPAFEVVVVTDQAGVEAIESMGWTDRIKVIPFDEANIAAARNRGIAASAGEIVAFIDDDAVPEPYWLAHLTDPFDSPTISAAGGFVRGRNGISYQWQARDIGPDGVSAPIILAGSDPVILEPTPGHGIKTEGCNMAYRRVMISDLGGFDPAYHFFLDESDLNLRLGALNALTAIVPLAEVHHGYRQSARRRSDRTPLDLFEIAASQAVFLNRHQPGLDPAPRRAQFRAEQKARIDRALVSGALEPRDVRRLMRSFDAGWQAGLERPLLPLSPILQDATSFRPLKRKASTGTSIAFAGRRHGKLSPKAKTAVEEGHIVTVYVMKPTMRPHKLRFTSEGYWLQTGGLFGRVKRSGPRLILKSRKKRAKQEVDRVAEVRGAAELRLV
ncbi:glycosyltransferase family 2 protein [Aestuariibius insulae]|uniref:glycosyltransferase family 2 protein n=1 Tax=Aestuariibius insulae TaxID=2058287 RepID=UPI00345F0EA5